MLVEMDKGMLASLVRGMNPAYEIMDDQLIKTKGYYCGGHSDRWIWNHGFESNCTEEDLWATYQLLKNPKKVVKQIKEPTAGSEKYLINKLGSIEGVTFVEVEDHSNCTISITVAGGEDQEIAYVLYMSLPAYLELEGNYIVRTIEHGFEHSYKINRK